jgi:hypothetical protein
MERSIPESGSFDSDFGKPLARNGWYLLVSLHLFLFVFAYYCAI